MTSPFPPADDRYEPESWPEIPSYVPTWLLDTPAPASPPLGLPLLPADRATDEPYHPDEPRATRHDEADPSPRREPEASWQHELNGGQHELNGGQHELNGWQHELDRWSWQHELDGSWQQELDDPWLVEPQDPRQRALYHLWREEPSHIWEPDARTFRPDLAAFRADLAAFRADPPASPRPDGTRHPEATRHQDTGPLPPLASGQASSVDGAATQVCAPGRPALPDAAALIPAQETRLEPVRALRPGGYRGPRRAAAVAGRRPGRHGRADTATPPPVTPLGAAPNGVATGRIMGPTGPRCVALLAGAGCALAALLTGRWAGGGWPGQVTVVTVLLTAAALGGHRLLARARSRSAARPGTAGPPRP
jgi:hypothetical protein